MSRKKRRISKEEAAVDLTPMIDVVFQLIIFFVVTVNLDQKAVMESIRLPPSKNSREEPKKDPRQVTIQVDEKGGFFIGSSRLPLRQLKIVLRNTYKTAGKDVPMLIRGDERAPHKHIRKAMDACAGAGFYKIKFAGMKRAAEDRRGPS